MSVKFRYKACHCICKDVKDRLSSNSKMLELRRPKNERYKRLKPGLRGWTSVSVGVNSIRPL